MYSIDGPNRHKGHDGWGLDEETSASLGFSVCTLLHIHYQYIILLTSLFTTCAIALPFTPQINRPNTKCHIPAAASRPLPPYPRKLYKHPLPQPPPVYIPDPLLRVRKSSSRSSLPKTPNTLPISPQDKLPKELTPRHKPQILVLQHRYFCSLRTPMPPIPHPRCLLPPWSLLYYNICYWVDSAKTPPPPRYRHIARGVFQISAVYLFGEEEGGSGAGW